MMSAFIVVQMLLSPMVGCTKSGRSQVFPAEKETGVEEAVTGLYISDHSSYRYDIMNYYLNVSPRSIYSPTNPFRVHRIPNGCRAVMMHGYVDCSGMATNSVVEYVTLSEERHVTADYVESFVSKVPNVKVLELAYRSPENSSFSESALDLGQFSGLKALRHLDVTYCGSVSNSTALLENPTIESLRLSITRQLSDDNPHAQNAGAAIPPCTCSGHEAVEGLRPMIEEVEMLNFEKGIRVFSLVNTNAEPVVLSALPDCCAGLSLHGRFDFSRIPENRKLQSIGWICHEATREEVETIPFSRFPNLKLLFLFIVADDKCELDFRKIDVCRSLEYVDISTDGNCVVRNIEDAFANERIWYFHCTLDRRKVIDRERTRETEPGCLRR